MNVNGQLKFGRLQNIAVPGVGIIQATGTGAIADGGEGYAPGCLYQRRDVAALYVNAGTFASCNFAAVQVGEPAVAPFYVTTQIPGVLAEDSANYGQFFIALRPCAVVAITEIHWQAASSVGLVSLCIERLRNNEAGGDGDLLHESAFDLKGNANTPQMAELVETGECALQGGDVLNAYPLNDLTNLRGVCVLVELEWL